MLHTVVFIIECQLKGYGWTIILNTKKRGEVKVHFLEFCFFFFIMQKKFTSFLYDRKGILQPYWYGIWHQGHI